RGAAALGLFLLALAVGVLWPTNTWDFPTYAALAVVILVLAEWRAGPRPTAAGMLRAAGLGAALLGLSHLLFLPFHGRYRSSFAGIERWRGSRTSLGDYLTIHGFFLFVIATALVLDLLLTRDQGATARTLRLLLRSGRPRRFLRLQRSLVRVSGLYALG